MHKIRELINIDKRHEDTVREAGIYIVTEVDHNPYGDVTVRQWTEYGALPDAQPWINVSSFSAAVLVAMIQESEAIAERNQTEGPIQLMMSLAPSQQCAHCGRNVLDHFVLRHMSDPHPFKRKEEANAEAFKRS